MAKDPRAFLQLAEEHRRSGRLKEAIAVCLEGLGRHPGLDAARITLGRAYLESGQAAIARDTLQEVFGRLPEHHLAGKLLAEAQQALGEMDAAEATCRALLRHYPRDREIEAILETVAHQDAPAAPGPSAPLPTPAPHASTAPSAPTAPRPDMPAPPAAAAAAAVDPEPEYRPEDVGQKQITPPPVARVTAPPIPAMAAPTASATPAVAAPVAPARPATRPAAAGGGDAMQTGTLADLYLRQGLVDRAIEVYRAMLRVDPGNQRARQRLAEIEAGAGEGWPPVQAAARGVVAPPGSGAQASPARPAPSALGAPAAATAPAAPSAEDDARRAAIARLEAWLDTVRRGSSGTGTSRT